MRATASLAHLWPVPVAVTVTVRRPKVYPPAGAHPITRDPAALERALVTLIDSVKRHAVSVGMLPEHDLQADIFAKRHGRLAALIADPVQEAHGNAITLLLAHAQLLLSPDQLTAMAERIRAHASHFDRYAADTRPRH